MKIGFFRVWYEPIAYFREIKDNCRISSGNLVLLFLFILASFLANYQLFSNRQLIEAMLTADEDYYTTDAQRESAMRVREATELALDQPGIALIIVGKVAWLTTRTLFFFLVFLWLGVSFLSSQWEPASRFLHAVSVPGSILVIGVVCNTFIKNILQRATAMFSPAFFIRPFNDNNFLHYLSYRSEFFTMWYLIIISIGLATLYEQKVMETLFLVLGIYYTAILLCFITDFGFTLL